MDVIQLSLENKQSTTNISKTADTNNFALWLGLALFSLVMIAVTSTIAIVAKRRK